MTWMAAPTGNPPLATSPSQTQLTMKLLFGIAFRQMTRFVESLLRLIRLDWAVPGFSRLSRRHKALKVSITHYRGSDGPLHISIDGTGIEGGSEGNALRHGGRKRRIRLKINIGTDDSSGGR